MSNDLTRLKSLANHDHVVGVYFSGFPLERSLGLTDRRVRPCILSGGNLDA
jgi:hypothetical protein